jgi:SWI/SNF-related matrix-associated actin-dependent regulator 1 of chromatin subfamily A
MATLTIQNGLYVWAGTFNERTLPKEAGFRWNPDLKRWEPRLPEKAYKLLNYATPETRADLEAKMAKMKADLEASAATDSTLVIPVPAGLDYLPYQKGGIAFAQSREGTLIGDEMGLGKTIQAIGIINLDPSIKRALIVCPASLKINWSRELKKWLARPLTVGIADGKTWPRPTSWSSTTTF